MSYAYRVALKNNLVVSLSDLSIDQLDELKEQVIAVIDNKTECLVEEEKEILEQVNSADVVANVKKIVRGFEKSYSNARIYSSKHKDGTKRIKFYGYTCKDKSSMLRALDSVLPDGATYKTIVTKWNQVESFVVYLPTGSY